MLKINNIEAGYEGTTIIRNLSFSLQEGRIVAVVGSNGAGKTTLMKTIVGFIKPTAGEIIFLGQKIHGLPTHEIIKKGISVVPEGRQIFDRLTVKENLYVGAYPRIDKNEIDNDINKMYKMFPILEERMKQKAGTFSGGQQQILAIARGLMSKPKLLILDEPSLGLSPIAAMNILETIAKLRDEGLTILLVEQDVAAALNIADQAIVIQNGKIALQGTGEELISSDMVRKAYLGM